MEALLKMCGEPSPEERYQILKQLYAEGDEDAQQMWSLLENYYPDSEEAQIRFYGFLDEILRQGTIPKQEALAAARKWGVERAVVGGILGLMR